MGGDVTGGGDAVSTLDVTLTPDEEQFLSDLLRLIGEEGGGEGGGEDGRVTGGEDGGDKTGGETFDLGDAGDSVPGGATAQEEITVRKPPGRTTGVTVIPDLFTGRTTGFRGLGTTGLQESLTAFRPAGEIRAGTGKPRKNVWNEASLRLKDALGL